MIKFLTEPAVLPNKALLCANNVEPLGAQRFSFRARQSQAQVQASNPDK
eukprot:CAMPEP_0172750576 /NCGR_PEP_ID=MMETSP1074-20121228/149891_1 /TAXON_ID=2916 /ORGANISM="Ceratium fusus, Strain PA161109" /LENGTH=48 /DNA_ID= /DNA_START= /DNA_END= /DNA_ORIENTATION=